MCAAEKFRIRLASFQLSYSIRILYILYKMSSLGFEAKVGRSRKSFPCQILTLDSDYMPFIVCLSRPVSFYICTYICRAHSDSSFYEVTFDVT